MDDRSRDPLEKSADQHRDVAALAGAVLQTYVQEFGLDPPRSTRSQNEDWAVWQTLSTLAASPSPSSVRWWADVAVAWLTAGHGECAGQCIARAHRLIEDGALGVLLPDLRRLVDIERDVHGFRQRAFSPPIPQRMRMDSERAYAKRARIEAIFGDEDRDARGRRFQEVCAKGDVLTMVLLATCDARSSFDRASWTSAWYRAGEHRIAVEEFLGAIRGAPLADWLSSVQDLLVECGMALRHLGDEITAFACFQLVAWVNPTPEKRENLSTVSTAEVAHRYVRELRWADPFLSSSEQLFRINPAGPQMGQWFLEHNISGRYVEYLKQEEGAMLLYPVPALQRQLRAMAVRSGWFLPNIHSVDFSSTGPRHAGGQPPEIVSSSLPDTPHNVEEPLRMMAHALPPPPQRPSSSQSSSTVRIPIGFSISAGRTVSAHADIGPNAHALVFGPAVNDRFLQSTIRHLVQSGKKVVWLRQNTEELGSVEGFRALRLLHADVGPAKNPQWLRDLAASAAVQTTVQDLLQLFSPCEDVAKRCVSSLVTQCGSEEISDALSSGDPKAMAITSVELVSSVSQIRFYAPSDLRRAADAVRHVLRSMGALHRGLNLRWRPAPEGQTRVDAVVVELPADQPFVAALSSALLLGSVLRTLEIATRMPREGDTLDDFDLRIRKRRGGSDPDRGSGPKLNPAPAPQRIYENPLTNNVWSDCGLIVPNDPQDIAVVASGWGVEIERLVPWFRPGGPAEHHSLVLAQPAAPAADLLRREVLERFRTFLLADFEPSQRRIFQIASGVMLHGSDDVAPSAENQVLVRLSDSEVQSVPIVVWPN